MPIQNMMSHFVHIAFATAELSGFTSTTTTTSR